jgi:hypothetical protein
MRGEVAVQIYSFLTSALDGNEIHAQVALTPKKGKPILIKKYDCLGPRTDQRFGGENIP